MENLETVLEFYCGIFQRGTGKSGNKARGTRLLVLESAGNILNSRQKYEMYGRL